MLGSYPFQIGSGASDSPLKQEADCGLFAGESIGNFSEVNASGNWILWQSPTPGVFFAISASEWVHKVLKQWRAEVVKRPHPLRVPVVP